MQVDLTSGGNRIIASGDTFLFGESNELTINVNGTNGFNVCVTMKFISDDSGDHRIVKDILEDRLVLLCYNFGGAGTGLSHPAHIANANNKKVYLMFWTYEEGIKERKARSVKYTLFCEE